MCYLQGFFRRYPDTTTSTHIHTPLFLTGNKTTVRRVQESLAGHCACSDYTWPPVIISVTLTKQIPSPPEKDNYLGMRPKWYKTKCLQRNSGSKLRNRMWKTERGDHVHLSAMQVKSLATHTHTHFQLRLANVHIRRDAVWQMQFVVFIKKHFPLHGLVQEDHKAQTQSKRFRTTRS